MPVKFTDLGKIFAIKGSSLPKAYQGAGLSLRSRQTLDITKDTGKPRSVNCLRLT